jgi:hypothetical protein
VPRGFHAGIPFSFPEFPAGGIRNLDFSIQAVHFSHNADVAQDEHFRAPWLTAPPAMLLYRPKLCIRCHWFAADKTRTGDGSTGNNGVRMNEKR